MEILRPLASGIAITIASGIANAQQPAAVDDQECIGTLCFEETVTTGEGPPTVQPPAPAPAP
ncbi:MAG: hypothetical protein AAF404_06930, partial [Pseudomonadota bacterium]